MNKILVLIASIFAFFANIFLVFLLYGKLENPGMTLKLIIALVLVFTTFQFILFFLKKTNPSGKNIETAIKNVPVEADKFSKEEEA